MGLFVSGILSTRQKLDSAKPLPPSGRSTLRLIAGGQQLVAGRSHGAAPKVRMIDVATASVKREFEGPTGKELVLSVDVSQDGQRIVAVATNRSTQVCTAYVWDHDSGNILRIIPCGFHEAFACARFLPNGSELLISSGDPDFGTRLWDLSQDREVRQYTQATTRARVIAISPDERTFAVIVGYRVRLFHTDDADWFRVIPAQKCSDVAFTSDGRHLIIGQADSLSIRSLASGDVIHELAAETVRFDAIATSPDGRFLVSGGGGVWSEEQGTIVGGRRKVSWDKSTVSVSR